VGAVVSDEKEDTLWFCAAYAVKVKQGDGVISVDATSLPFAVRAVDYHQAHVQRHVQQATEMIP
jgi:hypothetical protein